MSLTHLTRSNLSPDQRVVYESMRDWADSKNGKTILSVGGVAGSGKSTLLGLFAAEMNHLKIAFVSFTGRASSILGRKLNAAGCTTTNRMQTDNDRCLTGRWGHMFYSPSSPEAHKPFCGTIHRLILRPLINFSTEVLYGWEERTELDRKYDLIVIDEASMVDAQMVSRITRHNVRILAVGDHGQLPPVMGSGSLMAAPDLRLEKIHRQAEGSPIIKLSRAIREDHKMDRSLADGRQLVFASASDLRRKVIPEIIDRPALDVAFLCWRNQTRVHINRTVREYLGYAGVPPKKGEPVVCLKNFAPIYNGMRGILTQDVEQPYPDEWWIMRARVEFPDEGLPEETHEVCRDQFHRHETIRSPEEIKGAEIDTMSKVGRLFDFAYAMTVHKFQGSQVPHAIVQVDWRQNYADEMMRRLAYTAVTRASEKLTVLT